MTESEALTAAADLLHAPDRGNGKPQKLGMQSVLHLLADSVLRHASPPEYFGHVPSRDQLANGFIPTLGILLPAVAQPGGKAVDCQMDAGDDILIRIAGAIALQQLDLHVVERVKIREAVADRTRQ